MFYKTFEKDTPGTKEPSQTRFYPADDWRFRDAVTQFISPDDKASVLLERYSTQDNDITGCSLQRTA